MSNPFLFIDIETGDLDLQKSSILSISYRSNLSKTKTLYAKPPEGSFISKWSSENVWEPIKQRLGGEPVRTEKQLLEQTLGILEAHRGGTVAGWNIGYVADTQGERTKGLDVAGLVTRAEKYGLGEKYRAAFAGVKIKDIGREYSIRVAQEITKYPDLVDKKLYEQARSYTDLININSSLHRLYTIEEQAEWMATPGNYGGYDVAGWKQQDIYRSLFGEDYGGAHLSSEDTTAGSRIHFEGDPEKLKGPEFVSNWNTNALKRKAEATARRIAAEGDKTVNSSPAFASNRILSGGMEFAKRHKLGLGLGAAALGLYMLKPLSLFSGKDDEYNTIEGLRHGGMAERKRKSMTDFGSGWTGRMGPAFKAFGKGLLDKKSWKRGIHETFMTPEGRKELWDEAKWEIIGLSATSIYGAFKIAGKDDSYNTIEGMKHGGIAGNTRKENTDFGSGFLRRSWNVFRTLFNEGNRSISHTVKHMLIPGAKAGKPLELGVVGLGGYEAIHTVINAAGGTLSPGTFALSAATFVGSKYAYLAIKGRKTIKDAAKFAIENPEEAKSVTTLAAKSTWKEISDYTFHGRQNVFSSFAKHGGGDLGRQSVLAHLESKHNMRFSNVSDINHALGMNALSNAFSGKDDAFNIIEGLFHGGVAEQMRKKLTDFGSGWDALRGLLRGSETFAEMTASKEFQTALQSATLVKLLGKESAGEVHQMKGIFRGQEFSFARKTGKLGPYEALQQHSLSETISPTVYAYSGSHIDMEMFYGSTVKQAMEGGDWNIGEHIEMVDKLNLQYGQMHGDLGIHNVMITKDIAGNSHYGLIDFGKARQPDPFGQKATRPSILKQRWNENHKNAVMISARNGKYGGKGHQKY